uniref:Uncharacterized protein n=1 Tax=Tanacetum cinerariifolium TaxID=118510 RepID=A0A699IG41_TANCI|nr:hypothetical protein [Tanacetum cinerariifolium]
MDLLAFIYVADPTKVKIVEKERAEGEVKLLDTSIGRVVPLLPVSPTRTKSCGNPAFSSVSAIPEREGGDPTDSVTKPNLRTIGPSERSTAPLLVMTEAVITTNVASAPYILVPGAVAKINPQTEYYLSERRRLESKCERQADLLKARDGEIENLKAQLLLKEAEAAEAARLRIQVFAVEATEKVHADELNALKHKSVVLEDERDSLNGKITEL